MPSLKCPECKGEGLVWHTVLYLRSPSNDIGESFEESETCHYCNGDGTLPQFETIEESVLHGLTQLLKESDNETID